MPEAPDSLDVTLFLPAMEGITAVRLVSNAAPVLLPGVEPTLQRSADGDRWSISFRAPAGLRTTYSYQVEQDVLEPARWLDPGNPDTAWTSSGDRVSVLTLPMATPDPWARGRGSADWQVDSIAGPTGEPQEVWFHLPPGYDASADPYPVVIALNRFTFRYAMPTAAVIGNLVEDGAIAPPVLLVLDPLGQDSEADFRTTADWVADDVLPQVRERLNVATAGRDVVVAGASRRGLVAAAMALERPDAFGNVLALSGSFYWRPSPRDRYEWLAERYSLAADDRTRFYLAVGTLETVVTGTNAGHYPLATSRHFADVLEARGNDYLLEEFPGTHDEPNWTAWLGRGLIHLLGPGDGARLLGPGLLSLPGADDLQPAIGPDDNTLYFVRREPGGPFTLYYTRRHVEGEWSQPEPLPFTGQFNDQEPSPSRDGRRLYFTSDRPTTPGGERNRGREPWVAETMSVDPANLSWNDPRPLAPSLTLAQPADRETSRFWGQPRGPVEGPDGALYFWAERPDTHGHTDVYRSETASGGGFGAPTNLGPPINSERYETRTAFAPDGSWIVFGRDEAPGGYGLGDLYIAFREGSAWGDPVNMGPLVNSPGFDSSPSASPDGRFLYFSSNRRRLGDRSGRHDLYVVEMAAVLRALRR